MAERFNCTAATPWPGNTACHILVVHNDAHEVGEQQPGWPGGDIVTYECPHCGHRWTSEQPQ